MPLRIAPSRIVLVFVLASLVLALPAAASQPYGYAGKIVTDAPIAMPPGLPGFCPNVFQWFGGQYPMALDPADTVTMQMAIVPFPTGTIDVTLRFGGGGPVADPVDVIFSDGLVNGIPYDRNGWNDVVVEVHPRSLDYDLTVNGLHAGPFPYAADCTYVDCTVLNNFSFYGADTGGATAWIDSLSVIRRSAAGSDFFYGFNADDCSITPEFLSGGGVVRAVPPKSLHAAK